MTYTYKLAHRLAVVRSSNVLGLLVLATACGSDNLSPSGGSDTPAEASTEGAVVLMPRNVAAETDQPIKFAGFARSAAGDSLASPLQYTVTGGTISPSGIFSASAEGTYRIIANGDSKTRPDTGTVTILAARKGLSAIVVAPDTAKVATGGKQTFTATGSFNNGSTTAVGVNWTATGGTIDAGGTYTAGSVVGTYKVIATSASNSTLADTATVIVTTATPSPVLQAVVVTPSTASLQAGGTQQFVANGRMSDGTSSAVTVNWTATGGTVTAGGLYTAGSTPGTFQVIAKQANGTLAGTSAVTISATCTSTATMLCPGDNIQAKATAAGAGATLTLQPGIYRLQTVTPLANQKFIGQAGAIMSGAKLLTGWTQSGSTWYVGGQTALSPDNAGVCQSGTLCQLQEDVYRDNVRLTRVASLSAVTSGKFFFDYSAGRIYVGDDPTKHTLEVCNRLYAFEGNAQGAGAGVTISGLVIEKYGTPATQATIGRTGMPDNWTISNNEIRYNHGAGIEIGRTGAQILNNFIHHNGQLGMSGSGTAPAQGGPIPSNSLIQGNEISYNNTLAFTAEAGGIKLVNYATAYTIRNNSVHDNYYVGLWSDGWCNQIVYDGNRVENNTWGGITHEASYGAVISNNIVTGNGFFDPGGSEGAGIHIMNSGGNGTVTSGVAINIYGNTVSGNKNGIILLEAGRSEGTHTQNVSVHDNTVTLSANQTQDPASVGVRLYGGGDTRVWTTFNNRFTHNTYNLQTAVSAPFWWTSDHVSSALFTDVQWRAIPQDATGTFNR